MGNSGKFADVCHLTRFIYEMPVLPGTHQILQTRERVMVKFKHGIQCYYVYNWLTSFFRATGMYTEWTAILFIVLCESSAALIIASRMRS